MKQAPKSAPGGAPVRAWLGAVAVVALGTIVVVGYTRTPDLAAAPGAGLYDHAVKEALAGLRKHGTRQAGGQQRPALPAGLSAADHYWCEQCKAYHKRNSTPAQPGAVARPAAPGNPAGAGPAQPAL